MARSSRKRQRRSRQAWQKLIAEQASSGLSKQAFCQEHDLDEHRFHHWCRKLSVVTTTSPTPPFVELPALSAESAPAWRIELCLGEDLILRIG